MALTTRNLLEKYSLLIGTLICKGKKIDKFHPNDITFWSRGSNERTQIGEIIDIEKEGIRDWQVGSYVVKFKDDLVSTFELYQMPHCCGICVSTASNVAKSYQRMGIATCLNALRQDVASLLGYSLLLCTDCDGNEAQRKVLKNNDWKDIFSFINRRTGNKLNISVKKIPENI